MKYTVEDLFGNWLWSGWARDAAQAEELARGCNRTSVQPSEVLVVRS